MSSPSSRTEREELDYQYSPSRWSTRLPADVVVDAHIAAVLAASKSAREALECDLGIEYVEPGGPALDVYHPPSTAGQLGGKFMKFQCFLLWLLERWNSHCFTTGMGPHYVMHTSYLNWLYKRILGGVPLAWYEIFPCNETQEM